jgi:hypothetical protein
MKPRILIVGRETRAGYYQPYVDAVRGVGGELELFPQNSIPPYGE